MANREIVRAVTAEDSAPVPAAPAGERPDGINKDYIIGALVEENARLNENKILLTATVKQMQAEFQEAQALWAAERDSLLKGSAKEE